MPSELALPRGQGSSQTTGAPVATARWAFASEIEPYRYKGNGDIYLGIAHTAVKEAHGTIARLDALMATLAEDQDIAFNWKQEQATRIRHHWQCLMATARVPIGINDDRHQMLIAGTRSGKGISTIVPNLLLYPGSILVIDPKGSNARLTAARRGRGSSHCRGLGQKSYVLDPYGVSKVDASLRASFNPLSFLRPDDDDLIDRAASIADALVVKSGGDDAKHFDESARILIKGLILYLVLRASEEERNLPFLHKIANRGVRGTSFSFEGFDPNAEGVDPFRQFIGLMEQEEGLDGIVSGIAATVLDMGDREYGSVLSTMRQNLEFLERPAMRRVLSSSSFSFDELKSDANGVTVYLCLPVTRFQDCGRWLRLMVATCLESIYAETAPPACGHPVLMMLEEFAALGHMATIETAAGYAAEFGLKLLCVLQDLPQLKRHYPKGWETFLANSSVVQAFGNSDITTLDYLSKKLGETEIVQTTQSRTSSVAASSNDAGDFNLANALMQNRGVLSMINPLMLMFDRSAKGQTATTTMASNDQVQRSALLLPDEIERAFARERMTQIVLLKGERPMALHREAYYSAPEFLGLFDPDRAPFHSLEEAEAQKIRREQEDRRHAAGLIAEADKFISDVSAMIAAAKSEAARRRS